MLIVALPLLFKVIIDDGVPRTTGASWSPSRWSRGHRRPRRAAHPLFQRLLSSQVGEGLIFDLRTQVFEHLQRMPIAFFTRTQTGALVTRLNSDVMDAQRAFTDDLLVGGRQRHRPRGRARHDAPCPGRSRSSHWLLPLFLLPARWVGKRIQAITREATTSTRP